MTPAALADLVRSSAHDVLTQRGLDPAVLPATVTVQRPRHPAHGDYATNLALQTAAKAGVTPWEFAGWLAQALAAVPGVRSAEVAGPGYLNLRLEPAAQGEIVRQVLAAGERYGAGSSCDGNHQLRPGGSAPGRLVPDGSAPTAVGEAQYAHARLAALARNAADLGVSSEGAQLGLLEHQREGELIRLLGEFPRVVAVRDHQRVVRYLAQLASACHEFTSSCRVLPMGDQEPDPGHGARLALCQATRQVLANGLRRLGMSAPERM